MKIILLFFLIVSFETFSQNLKTNYCSENLEITFLDKETAKWEIKNHKMARDYLNIIIEDNGMPYKDKYFKDKSHLIKLIEEDSALFKEFNVVIGIKNEVPFVVFTELLCWLKDLGNYRVDEIQVYHFQ